MCWLWRSSGVDNLSVISVTIARLIVTSRAFEMRMGLYYHRPIIIIYTPNGETTVDKFTDIIIRLTGG